MKKSAENISYHFIDLKTEPLNRTKGQFMVSQRNFKIPKRLLLLYNYSQYDSLSQK